MAAIALALLVAGSVAYCVLVIPAALRVARRKPLTRPRPVTIITPVTGAEPGLEENLRSSFDQHYPEFEVVIVAHGADDPGLAVARKVMAAYSHVPARIVVSGPPPCPNGKVFNLEAAVAAARHDLLVMKDSDVRGGPDMLKAIAAEFEDPAVGLATCPYVAVAGGGFWWHLDAIGTNTRFLGGVLVARMLNGMDFALGPALAVRKQVIEKIGGLAQFRDYLAEDFLLGNRADAAGCGVILSSYAVEHHFGRGNFRANFRHRLRWMRSTRRSRGLAYAGEVFTHPLPLAAALVLADARWWPLAAAAVVLRGVDAWLATAYVLRAPLRIREWLLVPLDDFVSFGFWLLGLFGKHVSWRGRRYALSTDGRFERVD